MCSLCGVTVGVFTNLAFVDLDGVGEAGDLAVVFPESLDF